MKARKLRRELPPPEPEPIPLPPLVIVESVESQYDFYRGLPDVCWRYHRNGPYLEYQVAVQCFACGTWWGWVIESRLAELRSALEHGCSKCDDFEGGHVHEDEDDEDDDLERSILED
jgi:hypothetical protein